jgi:hypothetical protein
MEKYAMQEISKKEAASGALLDIQDKRVTYILWTEK